MTLSIISKLEEWVQPFKDWITENHGNPLLWVALLGLGIFVFITTYSALNRNG